MERLQPTVWPCQCVVHLGLVRERLVVAIAGGGEKFVPGKKRAVLGGRDVAIMELHLVQLGLRNGAIILYRV